MDWADFTSALYAMLEFQDPSGQANYNLILPRMLDDAELFLFRHPKLDFLATRTTDRTQTTLAGSRNVTIPSQFVVVEDVALITPANTQPNVAGAQRIPLTRATRQWIDFTWPQESQTQAPDPLNGGYFAIYTEQLPGAAQPPPEPEAGTQSKPSAIIISPTPDDVYVAEFRGTYRPERFDLVAGFDSATGDAVTPTATTFLSTYMPDLYLSAVMLISTAYQRAWGQSSDDPRMAVSWKAHLDEQIEVAGSEEMRKRAGVGGWSSFPLNPTLPGSGPPAGLPPHLAAQAAQ
jgi:hypothetical protein